MAKKSKVRVWPFEESDKYYLVDRVSPDIVVVLATGTLMEMAQQKEHFTRLEAEQKQTLVTAGQIELSGRLQLHLEVWPVQLNLFDKIENF